MSRWPLILIRAAFGVLYFFVKYGPLRTHAWIADLALVMYLIGSIAFDMIHQGPVSDLKGASGSADSAISK